MTPIGDRLRGAAAILADLDGTLIFGNRPASGAAELLRQAGERLAVVSNYSIMDATEMADWLGRMGLVLPPERIFLAGELAIHRVSQESPGARVLCLMTAPMRRFAVERGLVLADDDVDVVLIGRDLDFTYQRLAAAMRAVHAGARIVATNLDRSHPGAEGLAVPETGALVAAVTAASPGIAVEIVGKPQPHLFRQALAALGAPSHLAIMLGDNPETDGAGARAAGIPAILIGRGAGADVADLASLVASSFSPHLQDHNS